jgi:hypothetical protein
MPFPGLDRGDIATLAGYLTCLWRWADTTSVALFAREFHGLIAPSDREIFRRGLISPLTGFAIDTIRQGELLYNLCRVGLTDYSEIARLVVRTDRIYWFEIECGFIINEVDKRLYEQRRSEHRGFGRVQDALMHDDWAVLSETITLRGYDSLGACFPKSQDGQQDGLEELRIRDWDNLYPVGLGYCEKEIFSLLEFACRWGAVECIKLMLSHGAKATVGALWAAIQSRNEALVKEIDAKIAEYRVLDGPEILCAICFAIRFWRFRILDWLLRTKRVEWDLENLQWIVDNSWMCNNIIALRTVYENLQRTQRLPTLWLHIQWPLHSGNIELLSILPRPSDLPSTDDRDNFVKWAMRSGRAEALEWLWNLDHDLAGQHFSALRSGPDAPFYRRWLQARGDYSEVIARWCPEVGEWLT